MFPKNHVSFLETQSLSTTRMGNTNRQLSGEVLEGMAWVEGLWLCLTAFHLSFHPFNMIPSLLLLCFRFTTPQSLLCELFQPYMAPLWIKCALSVCFKLCLICACFSQNHIKATHTPCQDYNTSWLTDWQKTSYDKTQETINRSLTPIPCHESPPSVSQFYPRCSDHIMIFLLCFL